MCIYKDAQYIVHYTHVHNHMFWLCAGATLHGISTAALRWPAPAVHAHVGMLNPPGVSKPPDYRKSWILVHA